MAEASSPEVTPPGVAAKAPCLACEPVSTAPGVGIVIVAHAPAASALAATVAHVDASWLPRVAVFDMTADMTRERAAQRIVDLITASGWTQCLLLVDLMGAGPCWAAAQAVKAVGPQFAHVVTGVNAPMLLSLLAQPPFADLRCAARFARSRGRRGIVLPAHGIG